MLVLIASVTLISGSIAHSFVPTLQNTQIQNLSHSENTSADCTVLNTLVLFTGGQIKMKLQKYYTLQFVH